MKKIAAAFLISFGVVLAFAFTEDFKSQVVTTTNSPLTIIVPSQTYLRIHNFTQNGGTQRGNVTSIAGTPMPSPTATASPTATPTLSTTAGPGVVLNSGVNLNDTATLSGNNPTGTITFTLTDPSGNQVYTDVVSVSGNNTYSTASGNNPGGFSPTETGTYTWSALYSGDINNASATDNGQNESETVTTTSTTPTPTPTVTPIPIPGVVLTATIVGANAIEPVKGITIAGPATVTVTRGDADCVITYNKRSQATPTPTP